MATRRVLVVAAHPDDDILGAGGYIARLAAAGARVEVLLLSDGVTSREIQPQDVLQRQASARSALTALGVHEPHLHHFPDNAMDSIPLLDIAKVVTASVESIEPDTLITHSLADLNIDHRITAEASLIAARPQPGSPVRRLLQFEVPSATGWRPSARTFDPRFFVDVSAFVEAKMSALRCYDQEMRPWPHARSYESVDALLRWRGASVGVEAAEAFEVGLWVED
jgi:LmbE family N-acetylglucosaminyl deacetylase